MRICIHCDEEILPGEMIPDCEGKLHRECLIRSIVGSVAHQKRNSLICDGGCRDEKNLSARENAKAAMRYFLKIQEKATTAKFN